VTVKIVVNKAGVAEVLRFPKLAAVLGDAAGEIASAVTAQGLPVESPGEDHPELTLTAHADSEIRDTAVGIVSIPHPAALPMQAHHGVLTKAAASVGLEVHA
jgi:hypothetical protein